jgi:hypothetical protein
VLPAVTVVDEKTPDDVLNIPSDLVSWQFKGPTSARIQVCVSLVSPNARTPLTSFVFLFMEGFKAAMTTEATNNNKPSNENDLSDSNFINNILEINK